MLQRYEIAIYSLILFSCFLLLTIIFLICYNNCKRRQNAIRNESRRIDNIGEEGNNKTNEKNTEMKTIKCFHFFKEPFNSKTKLNKSTSTPNLASEDKDNDYEQLHESNLIANNAETLNSDSSIIKTNSVKNKLINKSNGLLNTGLNENSNYGTTTSSLIHYHHHNQQQPVDNRNPLASSQLVISNNAEINQSLKKGFYNHHLNSNLAINKRDSINSNTTATTSTISNNKYCKFNKINENSNEDYHDASGVDNALDYCHNYNNHDESVLKQISNDSSFISNNSNLNSSNSFYYNKHNNNNNNNNNNKNKDNDCSDINESVSEKPFEFTNLIYRLKDSFMQLISPEDRHEKQVLCDSKRNSAHFNEYSSVMMIPKEDSISVAGTEMRELSAACKTKSAEFSQQNKYKKTALHSTRSECTNIKPTMNKIEIFQQEQKMLKPQFSLLNPQLSTVSIEQQQKIPSPYSSTNSNISLKRLSVAETNLSEKFWVPEEIALTSQLSKKRTSIANLNLNHTAAKVNEAFNISEVSINTSDQQSEMNERRESAPGPFCLSQKRCSVLNTRGRRASMFDPIDPTELQKALYQERNVISTAQNHDENAPGNIDITLFYSTDKQKLKIESLYCSLNSKSNHQIDTFCRVSLLPEKISCQTEIAYRTSSPRFDKCIDFNLDNSQMESYTLEIEVFSVNDKNMKEECVGYTRFRLSTIERNVKTMVSKELKVTSKTVETEYVGDIMFSLGYLPSAERLTVIIMKCRNLKTLDTVKKTPPDALIKISLISKDGKKLKKKKTSTQKCTTNPVYNEEIVFTNVSKEQLQDSEIRLVVIHDSIASRDILGFLKLSSSSLNDEYEHWKEMMENKKAIAWWHQLKPNTMKKRKSLSNVLSNYHYYHTNESPKKLSLKYDKSELTSTIDESVIEYQDELNELSNKGFGSLNLSPDLGSPNSPNAATNAFNFIQMTNKLYEYKNTSEVSSKIPSTTGAIFQQSESKRKAS